MNWFGLLKTALRNKRPPAHPLSSGGAFSLMGFLFLFLIISCSDTQRDQATIALKREVRGSSLDLEITGFPQEEFLEALREGFRNQVTFEIKVYRTNSWFPGIFPDILLEEHVIIQEASWDPFQGVYTLDSDFGGKISFSHPGLMVPSLTRIRGFELATLKDGNVEEDRHLLVRARLMPVKLRAPLNILTLFNFAPHYQSPWERLDLEIQP